MEHITHNEEETKKVASAFAQTLKGGDVIYLHGDLGAGKTTFVRGVAEHFGFSEPVRSPSFTIVNRYPVEHETIKTILHVDLYRIEDPSELAPLALEDELGRPDVIGFIEWAEKGGEALVPATKNITFAIEGDAHKILEK
jgi:tRNA threonylcarbamoyladenosine biosynthesis protein TsaE